MNIRNPSIPPVRVQGGGPGEYFRRKTNARGQKREPAPKDLLGDPPHFDHLVRCSHSAHPHLHAVLGYKNEPVQPPRETKDRILQMYLHVLRAGLAREKVYVLAVDHGDHDHVAVFRHLVTRDWRRFQPYYHENDWLLKSDFQWLVNRRYGFNAPEDPRNAQYISLAGRNAGRDQIEFLSKLRNEIASGKHPEFFSTHDAFRKHLDDDLRCTSEMFVRAEDSDDFDDDVDEDDNSRRAWMKVITQEKHVISLKGPLCQPGFTFEEHQSELTKKTKRYTDFLRDPSGIWKRFRDGYRKKREQNLELHPGLCEPDGSNPFKGFEDLEPSRQIKIAPELSATIA